jgi:hypothetical protein
MRQLSDDLVGVKWTDASREELRARVIHLAHRVAEERAMHPDAADCVAAYALATLTIEGFSLENATVENLRGKRNGDVDRG